MKLYGVGLGLCVGGSGGGVAHLWEVNKAAASGLGLALFGLLLMLIALRRAQLGWNTW